MPADWQEKTITGLFFIGVFLPIRLVFYTYVTDWWLGSLGVMTSILIIIFWLNKKGRMGRLGFVITKQTEKIAKGKLGKIGIIMSCVAVYMFAHFIYGVETAPPDLVQVMKTEMDEQGVSNVETLVEASRGHTMSWWHIGLAFAILMFPNEVSHAVFGTINNLTDGWAMHWATVFLVQELEFLGIIVYFRYKKTLSKTTSM